ncbi:MAG TPA: hypothetical protein VHK69_06245 [Chitinophagaceae bacterium]|nr:hypothetical protein [Chitinophagaceae bacterium]
MYRWLYTLMAGTFTLTGCAQSAPTVASEDRSVLEPCEGCEAIYECPVPFTALTATDTLPGYAGSRRPFRLQGVVYRPDGKTPAAGVVIYAYHTDSTGVYPAPEGAQDWSRRHGALRGWVRTDAQGRYTFFTTLPAPYPGRNAPAHVHLTVKEPGVGAYWIDDVEFKGDPLLPASRSGYREQGGPGLVTLSRNGERWEAFRPIYLGRQVAGYPARR